MGGSFLSGALHRLSVMSNTYQLPMKPTFTDKTVGMPDLVQGLHHGSIRDVQAAVSTRKARHSILAMSLAHELPIYQVHIVGCLAHVHAAFRAAIARKMPNLVTHLHESLTDFDLGVTGHANGSQLAQRHDVGRIRRNHR